MVWGEREKLEENDEELQVTAHMGSALFIGSLSLLFMTWF